MDAGVHPAGRKLTDNLTILATWLPIDSWVVELWWFDQANTDASTEAEDPASSIL